MNNHKKKQSLRSLMGVKLYRCRIVGNYHRKYSKFESAISKVRLKQMFKRLEQLADEYIGNTVESFKE